MSEFPVVGLTGRPAGGKSVLAGVAAQHGWHVIDVDRTGHDALKQPSVIADLWDRFGSSILNADGMVMRTELGKIVFASREALADLERIVHPCMVEMVLREAGEHRGNKPVLIDAAILAHMDLAKHCDRIWVVETPWSLRVTNAAARGWSEDELRRRDGSYPDTPLPPGVRVDVIRNESTLEDWQKKSERFIKGIKP